MLLLAVGFTLGDATQHSVTISELTLTFRGEPTAVRSTDDKAGIIQDAVAIGDGHAHVVVNVPADNVTNRRQIIPKIMHRPSRRGGRDRPVAVDQRFPLAGRDVKHILARLNAIRSVMHAMRFGDLVDREPPTFDALDKFDHRSSLRSEEHTSELQSLIRIPYAVF